MEALVKLADNGLWSLGLMVVVLIGLWIAVKKGYIVFKGHGLQIGQDQETRSLIRNMWEYTDSCCEAQFVKVRPYCKSDEQCKYVIAKVQDVFQKAIVYNCIEAKENYVKAKQALVLNTIQKRLDNEHFFSDEFRACCNRFVENVIRDLVRMKKVE